jgi:hypothetical protein
VCVNFVLSRVYRGVRYRAGVCTDAGRVAETLNLKGWLRRRRGHKGGVRGVVIILGNSDHLDRVLDGDGDDGGEDGSDGDDDDDEDELKEELRAMVGRVYDEEDGGGGRGKGRGKGRGGCQWGSLPPGLTAAEARSRLQLMFSRGVARAAASIKAVVITSGTDQGAVSFRV